MDWTNQVHTLETSGGDSCEDGNQSSDCVKYVNSLLGKPLTASQRRMQLREDNSFLLSTQINYEGLPN
jgi:hypothetical protein